MTELDDPLEPTEAEPTSSDRERFEQRRREVAESSRVKRRRIAIAVAAILGLVAVVAGVLYSPLVDVDRIEWIGAGDAEVSRLAGDAGLHRGDPLFRVNPTAIANRLQQQPIFSRVSVRRRWPDTVEIRVTRREPAVVIAGAEGRTAVALDSISLGVPAEGAVLREISAPWFDGVAAGTRVDESMAKVIEFVAALPLAIATKVTGVDVSETYELTLRVDTTATILVGDMADQHKKLRSLAAMLGGTVDLADMCQLDIRTPGAPKLRRAPHCS